MTTGEITLQDSEEDKTMREITETEINHLNQTVWETQDLMDRLSEDEGLTFSQYYWELLEESLNILSSLLNRDKKEIE